MIENQIAAGIIKECLAKGIREYVVCSGARNLALISELLKYEDVVVWSHYEERAAGFFALGRMMDSREPCAVITTSGTAVAELLPATIESFYQSRPLVIISADRPVEFRGSGAPQAIEQVGIFGGYVERSLDISESVSNIFDGWTGRRPWHLNVCLGEDVAELVSDVDAEAIGEWKPEREKIDVSALIAFFEEVWQGVVVMVGGLEPEDREEVLHFLKAIKVPAVVDATSGLRELLGGYCLVNADEVLLENTPAKILRIGEVPVGRFWRDLEHMLDVEVLSLSRTGFSGLARKSEVISGSISRILKGAEASEFSEVGDVIDLLGKNSRRASQLDELLESYPDSEPAMVRLLSMYASVGESLYLGNSLPIREWGEFAQREHPIEIVRANRGANGIDGQLATWAGWTHGIDDAWVLLGDLTTLYDLSAPSLLHDCDAQGRVIVVMNNGGGRIFDRLPRVQQMDTGQREIIANEHAFNFESWAMMWGWDYMRVDDADDLEIEGGAVPLVVELVPSEKQTAAFWEAYKGLNKK